MARKQERAFRDMAVQRTFPGARRPSLRLESWMQLARVMQERENGKAGDGYLGKWQPAAEFSMRSRTVDRLGKRFEARGHVGAVMGQPMVFAALRFAPGKMHSGQPRP